MSDIKIDANSQTQGLNKQGLLAVENDEISAMYAKVFERNQGLFTVVEDNDVEGRFKVAKATLNPNEIQTEKLEKFENSFRNVEMKIDPDRLIFSITRALDDEIILSRHSNSGVSNLIINEDGSLAYSFISYKGIDKNDDMSFYNVEDEIDFEQLSYRFLSF